MKILHIEINEYESDKELSDSMSSMDVGPFVIAVNQKDAEVQLENLFMAEKDKTRVFYSTSYRFKAINSLSKSKTYYVLYECLYD